MYQQVYFEDIVILCEVAAVSGVAGRHHVLGVEHLLGQLGHGEGSKRVNKLAEW